VPPNIPFCGYSDNTFPSFVEFSDQGTQRKLQLIGLGGLLNMKGINNYPLQKVNFANNVM